MACILLALSPSEEERIFLVGNERIYFLAGFEWVRCYNHGPTLSSIADKEYLNYHYSVPRLVALVFFQDEARLSISQIQDHFCKVAICPRKPTSSVGRGLIDGLGLVDET